MGEQSGSGWNWDGLFVDRLVSRNIGRRPWVFLPTADVLGSCDHVVWRIARGLVACQRSAVSVCLWI